MQKNQNPAPTAPSAPEAGIMFAVKISPELKRWLKVHAATTGQRIQDCANAALEQYRASCESATATPKRRAK
jgi:hypothetical protein